MVDTARGRQEISTVLIAREGLWAACREMFVNVVDEAGMFDVRLRVMVMVQRETLKLNLLCCHDFRRESSTIDKLSCYMVYTKVVNERIPRATWEICHVATLIFGYSA